MNRRIRWLYIASGAVSGILVGIVLLILGFSGAGSKRSVARQDEVIECVGPAGMDANQPPGTSRKHTIILDGIVWKDPSLGRGQEYDPLREMLAKVRLGITDSVSVDEQGTSMFGDNHPPELFVVLPDDWPEDWALSKEIDGFGFHNARDGGPPGGQKLFGIYFTVRTTGKPVVKMGPLGIVRGKEFSWILDIDLRPE